MKIFPFRGGTLVPILPGLYYCFWLLFLQKVFFLIRSQETASNDLIWYLFNFQYWFPLFQFSISRYHSNLLSIFNAFFVLHYIFNFTFCLLVFSLQYSLRVLTCTLDLDFYLFIFLYIFFARLYCLTLSYIRQIKCQSKFLPLKVHKFNYTNLNIKKFSFNLFYCVHSYLFIFIKLRFYYFVIYFFYF